MSGGSSSYNVTATVIYKCSDSSDRFEIVM